MKKVNKNIKLDYEYKPNKFSQQKLDSVFDLLFNEIGQLIIKEKNNSSNKTNEKIKWLQTNT